MKQFFRHNGLLMLVIAALLSAFIGAGSFFLEGRTDPISNALSVVTTPVRNGIRAVADWGEGVYEYVLRYDQIQEELFSYQEKAYKNVLPYSVGIYCTAYQRLMLMEMALKAGIDKLCYTDTDSLKGRYSNADLKIFEEENERIIKWTFDRCIEQGIEYELTCPKDTEGVPQYIGTWEHDASYYDIKFLGAKRYAYRYAKDDCVHITVAGVPKSAQRALKSLKQFKEGLKFDLFNSHKNLITYLDGNNPEVIFPDGYVVKNKYAANIRPTSYTLSLTADFRDLIKHYLAMKYH